MTATASSPVDINSAARFNVEFRHDASANDCERIPKVYSDALDLVAVHQKHIGRHNDFFGDIKRINAIIHSVARNRKRVLLNYARYEGIGVPFIVNSDAVNVKVAASKLNEDGIGGPGFITT